MTRTRKQYRMLDSKELCNWCRNDGRHRSGCSMEVREERREERRKKERETITRSPVRSNAGLVIMRTRIGIVTRISGHGLPNPEQHSSIDPS
jgi:hypothetical protein